MGWLALQGLGLALLIDSEHDGFIRRIEIERDNSVPFSTNIGSLLTLKESTRWGWSPRRARCARPTARMPASLPLRRLLQWVRARGVLSSVLVRILDLLVIDAAWCSTAGCVAKGLHPSVGLTAAPLAHRRQRDLCCAAISVFVNPL